MENTTQLNDKLLLENITERIETTHESYQTTSIDGKVVEENQVVFQSTQEIVTTINQPLEDNSFFQPVNENSSILEQNKFNDEVNVNAGNDTSENAEQAPLMTDVIENDPELNLATEDDTSLSHSVSRRDTESASCNILAENRPTSQAQGQGGETNEYNSEYMLEHQSENVYMPEKKQEEPRLVSDQVYATEMISDDSQDNNGIFTNETEQNSKEERNAFGTEAESVINPTEGTEDLNSTQQGLEQGQEQTDIDREPLKSDISNLASVGAVGSDIENQNVNMSVDNENSVIEEITEGEQENVEGDALDVKEKDIHANITPSEDVNQSVSDNVEEMDTTEQVIEEEQAIDTSNEENVELMNVSATSTENITLENYDLPEGLEVTEVQEGEYQTEQGNSDGTLVLVQSYEPNENFEQTSEEGSLLQMSDNQHELYLTDLRNQAESRQSTSSTSSDTKPRRGRRPTFEVPMHVLGHDISKPVESVPNGRALPKPRLGVKVPYRNLTSQIVSKAEIEKEIMERARLKQEQAIAKGDVLFARKLTQRLARKIAPSPNHPKRASTTVKSQDVKPESKEAEGELTDPLALEPDEVLASQEQTQKINNDSDLLAILEGEGDDMPVLPKEVPQPMHDDVDVKMLEREIALQQLQDLPHLEPKQRIFRGRYAKVEAPLLTAEASALLKIKAAEKARSASKHTSSSPAQTAKKADLPPQTVSSDKENTSKHAKEAATTSPKRDHSKVDLTSSPRKGNVEVEPQVKVNMVLKTYSRKRKTIELPEPFPESPIHKKPMLYENEAKIDKSDAPSDVYVTKSSRVIKKKVIWDPDEIPARSPKPVKGDSPVKAPKPQPEKVPEKKPATEKVVKEKSPEKKPAEKPVAKKSATEKAASPAEKKPTKTESPKNSKTPIKNKKSLSEVDKLLMDEGAIKMLYELRNTDEPSTKKKKDVYSVERAQKEIMKKANEIKNDLQQNTSNESPKSLRKKAEGFPPSLLKPALIAGGGERKMSKDSTRSSLHTPPGSPAYSQSSMLVRRRSSSSISSSDEVSTDENGKAARRRSASDISKPKKAKKTEEPKAVEAAKEATQAKPTAVENKPNQFKSFTVKKSSKHVTIDLSYADDKCYCTPQVLEELTIALKKYSKDKDCNVVSITSSSKTFCSGLDYGFLLSEKEDVRRKNAVELSGRMRDFLLCLLHFPKVLVAGIKGECVGLGVTMLPLFDIVIASDTATFSTPYASLGCVAEAGFLLSSPHLTNHGLAAELLFTTQKLTADDVFRRGLISRLCWPEKYNETLKTILSSISKGSKQSLEATKKQLRRHLVQSTEAAINAESKVLVEHWTGAECQKSFARLKEAGN